MDSLGASGTSTTPESGPVGFQFLSQKGPQTDRFTAKTPRKEPLQGPKPKSLSATALRRLCLDDFDGVFFLASQHVGEQKVPFSGASKNCATKWRASEIFFERVCFFVFWGNKKLASYMEKRMSKDPC